MHSIMVGEKALMALEEILSERLMVESVRVTFTVRRSAEMRKVRYMAKLVYAKYVLDIVVWLVAAVYAAAKKWVVSTGGSN